MRRTPRTLTLSPGGIQGGRATVAGCRAGALGLLDLAFEPDPAQAIEAVGRVGRYLGARAFGVRVDLGSASRSFLGRLPDNLAVVVVANGGVAGDWPGAREAVHA